MSATTRNNCILCEGAFGDNHLRKYAQRVFYRHLCDTCLLIMPPPAIFNDRYRSLTMRGEKDKNTLTRPELAQIIYQSMGFCAYCGRYFGISLLALEHRIPVCAGGSATSDNIVAACERCNLDKMRQTWELPQIERTFIPLERVAVIEFNESHQHAYVLDPHNVIRRQVCCLRGQINSRECPMSYACSVGATMRTRSLAATRSIYEWSQAPEWAQRVLSSKEFRPDEPAIAPTIFWGRWSTGAQGSRLSIAHAFREKPPAPCWQPLPMCGLRGKAATGIIITSAPPEPLTQPAYDQWAMRACRRCLSVRQS